MSELRWILLLVGVLFLVLLTAWESRRSRLARAVALERSRVATESLLFERAPSTEPLALGPRLEELPAQVTESDDAIRAVRRGSFSDELPNISIDAHEHVPAAEEFSADSSSAAAERSADIDGAAGANADMDTGASETADIGGASDAGVGAYAAADEGAPDDAPQTVNVEWPPEEQRRIVSVRIVSSGEQRLSGRTTRQALAACGFVHGRYRIFHQPDSQGQALLSCASLNKPGVFDPASMDYQRYTGLSLFTVLPGPLATPDAVDRLLFTALDLSERLQARLQDDEGQTLDDARIAELRTRYRQLDAMAGPPA